MLSLGDRLMPVRPSAKRVAAEAAAHLDRSEMWNGLRSGDPVIIDGIRTRGVSWQFRAHVVNERNGTESIEVVGGRPGDRTVRSFDPERVFAVHRQSRGKRTRRDGGQLSLAEEPQLPLG